MSRPAKVIRLELPRLHAGQRQVARESRRFNVLACGRRWGKTLFGIDRIVDPALAGYPVGWFSPSYRMLAEVWRDALRALAPVTARASAQEHRIELVTGGVVEMWSLDNPNTARGRRYKRVIVDEAALVRSLEEGWSAAIRPTLTDFQGDAWFLSTPRLLNFFSRLYSYGADPQRPDWASWQMPTLANPHIKPTEVEAARGELPERTFQQEYEARFLDGEGSVFRRIRENLTAPDSSPSEHRGHFLVMGVDWAREVDFTVLSVVCATCMQEVALDRFNQIGWAIQRGRLTALGARWGVRHYLVEENSIGSVNLEALQLDGLPAYGFLTTATSKPQIVQSLALALENLEVRWLPDPVGRAELEAFESRVSRITGRVQYGAPEGGHDDVVIARALALRAALLGGPAINADVAARLYGVA